MRKLNATESRIAAVGLTLLVLVLAWLLLFHWWFVAPLRAVNGQMQSLREDQQRYTGIVAQRDVLRQRLASLSRDQADVGDLLAGDDSHAATATLMQHVVERVAAHAALGTCEVTQKMPVPATGKPDAPYQRVSANINMRCGMQALAAVLHDMAHGKPRLFVDNFSVYRNPVKSRDGSVPPLDVQMTVSGYAQRKTSAKAAGGGA